MPETHMPGEVGKGQPGLITAANEPDLLFSSLFSSMLQYSTAIASSSSTYKVLKDGRGAVRKIEKTLSNDKLISS